jgi:hypothetical protein
MSYSDVEISMLEFTGENSLFAVTVTLTYAT